MTVTAIITGGTRFLAAFLGGALLVGALGPVAAEAQNRTEHIFDDWRVVCQEEADPENNARCHMVQTLIQNETQREILRWMIVSDGENQAMHAVSAPLGVLLRPGIQLSSGDQDAASLSYSVCDRRWCHARQPMSEELRNLMANGNPVEVVYTNRRGQRLRMAATMRGFSEAIAFMEDQNAG